MVVRQMEICLSNKRCASLDFIAFMDITFGDLNMQSNACAVLLDFLTFLASLVEQLSPIHSSDVCGMHEFMPDLCMTIG